MLSEAIGYWQQALVQDGAFLRPLAGALAYGLLVAAIGRAIPRGIAAAIALAVSLWVLTTAWLAFVGVAALVYLATWLVVRSDRRTFWTHVLLVTLAAVFVVGRARGWDRFVSFVFDAPVAMYYLDMWMALRLFTFIWEVGGGLAPIPDAAGYAGWMANPLLLAGPLVRLSQWPQQIVGHRQALASARRGIGGVAMVIAGVSIDAAALALRNRVGADALAVKVASVLFIGPWTFYLTVGGLFQVVEWLGTWCGIDVPVSFRFPFFRPNIAEFWARWNLTATAVFRDYFFYNRWGLRGYNVYLNTLIVFVAVGLWHGSNIYWLSFGALHGLYFCAYLWCRPRLASLAGRPWFHYTAIAVTYVAICAAWYVPSKISVALTRR